MNTVDVQWENTNLPYNGQTQSPAAFYREANGQRIPLTVDGSSVDSSSITVKAMLPADLITRNVLNDQMEFTVSPREAAASWGNAAFTYNGKAQAPTASYVDVNGRSVALHVSGAQTDAGTYTATASTADGNYRLTGETARFTIASKALTHADIDLRGIPNQTWTGKEITPPLTIYDGATRLQEGKDYTAAYTRNRNTGNAEVVVRGVGNYTGERAVTFRIVAKEADEQAEDKSILPENLLFDAQGRARPYRTSNGPGVLALKAEPDRDAQGQPILRPDGAPQYSQRSVRLTAADIRALRKLMYKQLYFLVDDALLMIPLEALSGGYSFSLIPVAEGEALPEEQAALIGRTILAGQWRVAITCDGREVTEPIAGLALGLRTTDEEAEERAMLYVPALGTERLLPARYLTERAVRPLEGAFYAADVPGDGFYTLAE